MAELYEAHASHHVAQFLRDYFATFARLLDPNLPPPARIEDAREGEPLWPLGQTAAFTTIVAIGVVGTLSAVIHYSV